MIASFARPGSLEGRLVRILDESPARRPRRAEPPAAQGAPEPWPLPSPSRTRPTSRRRSPRWCASSPTSRSSRTPSTSTTRTSSPSRIVEQLKELGLFGVTIPEEYGGMGLDLTTYVMIVEELTRGWISISGVINTHFIGSYLLMKYGSEEQKQKYLPRMATGEIRAAFSLSEPELGSDVQAIKTSRQEGRRRHVRDQRPEDVGHQRPALRPRLRARQDRPGRRAAPQGHDLLHHREGGGRPREHRRVRRPHRPAADQEARLQGRRVHRARLRRLPVPGRRTSSAARTPG